MLKNIPLLLRSIIGEFEWEAFFEESRTMHTFTCKNNASFIEVISARDATDLIGTQRRPLHQ